MVGVDEVGRGCLAGPLLVVAARQTDELPDGLRDSKLMTRKQRGAVCQLLTASCQFGEGWVKASEIDKYGLSKALRLGVSRALRSLRIIADDEITLDGKLNYIPKKFKNSRCIVGADSLVPIVSAASVYAKVTRDNFMFELAKKHPSYGFENHVGYGTLEHKEALESLGVLRFVHRSSYSPISKLLGAS